MPQDTHLGVPAYSESSWGMYYACSRHELRLSISYHFRALFGDIIGDNVGDLIDDVMKLDIANEARASCEWNSKTGFSGCDFCD